MKSIVNSVCVSLLSLFLFADVTQANLIQNGSLESPGFTANAGPGRWKVVANSTDITGWVVGGSGDIFVQQTPFDGGPVYNPAQDGSHYVDLSGDGAPHGTLYQDFATTIGAEYLLTFYIGSASSQPSSTINVGLLGAGTLLDTTLTPLAPNGNLNWLQESFLFTADSESTRLSFVDTSAIDDNASFVDNVSVSSVPESSSSMLLLFMGLGSMIFLRHRVPRLV